MPTAETDYQPDDRAPARRMIPKLKWILVSYAIIMVVIVVLALTGVIELITPIAGLGPAFYVLLRRFTDGSWDWMYQTTR